MELLLPLTCSFKNTSLQKNYIYLVPLKVSYIGDKEAGIENATRVAILNEGSVDNEASARSLKNAREAVIFGNQIMIHILNMELVMP